MRGTIAGRKGLVIFACFSVCVGVVDADAAGFFIGQQSVEGVGRAFAGGAAVAADASTIFTNPAGMTELRRGQAMIGANLLLPNVQFSNKGSTATTPGTLGAALRYRGGSGGNPFSGSVVPNIYAAYPLLENRLWLGVGLSAPFGLDLKYDDGWFGRYDSIKSRLTTIDVAPSAAYRLTDYLSIGGGVDIQYADATLTSAIPDTLEPGGPTLATDGRNSLKGDDWSVGFNVGILVKPLPTTRVGLHYRSRIDHTLEGENEASRLGGALATANGAFTAKADLKLPDIVSLAVAHQIVPKLTLLGEVQWFNWSRFSEVRVKFANGASDLVIPENYQDSYAVSIGAEYAWTDAWTVRGGFRYETTPTVDRWRNTSVPDADNYSLGIGASYRMFDRLVVDLSVFHTRWEESKIRLTREFFKATPASGTVNVNGNASSHSTTLAVNFRLDF